MYTENGVLSVETTSSWVLLLHWGQTHPGHLLHHDNQQKVQQPATKTVLERGDM